jgi:hypothetical protein
MTKHYPRDFRPMTVSDILSATRGLELHAKTDDKIRELIRVHSGIDVFASRSASGILMRADKGLRALIVHTWRPTEEPYHRQSSDAIFCVRADPVRTQPVIYGK